VKVGRKVPAFRLQDETGVQVSLADLRGKRLVLFFFQKASTPGCTAQACEYRDALPRLTRAGVTVFGISPDTWRRHAKFRAAQGLPYTLLADKGAVACQAYDVWHEKLFWGKRYMGVVRSTFVVDAEGRLEQEWRDVPHEGHVAVVDAWLRGAPAPGKPVRNAARKRAKGGAKE